MSSFFQITLHRSAIGLPQRTRDALAALGLRRRNQTVVHAVGASTAGLLFRVKELVRVQEITAADRETPLAQLRAARRPPAGFVVARKYAPATAGAGAAATAATTTTTATSGTTGNSSGDTTLNNQP
ncbi:Ribosomal protein L30, bacterial-type [Niveomyces insectorum RCEF 264]|uniref:Large ribosomal subunit protein uL30m n=1 Tax=Niveomyces insectorum RCEF 264 TaxID=1081102 RepID=A0A167TTV9_9HYPO|nr:Ribosomal protein L30, bacterial-type [Niveomyces insectorum RCEF 264]